MTPAAGAFVVRASTVVSAAPSAPETRRIAASLAAMLGVKVGSSGPVSLELGGPAARGTS